MNRSVVETSSAPAAVGAYSQAIKVSQAQTLVFVSGQIGLDPSSGALVDGGIEAQAKCALKNLQAVLAASGMSFSNVVRATLYLTDMAEFQKVNKLYAECFEGEPPARVTIGVASLPLGAVFEIDAIAAQ